MEAAALPLQTSGVFELGRPPKRAASDAQARLRAELGQKLREARAAAGMSQVELAKATGIRQSYISEVESGRHNLSLSTVTKLATALGVSVRFELRAEASPRKK